MFLADTNLLSELDVPDAFLAATARVHDLILVTRNVRHFDAVPDLGVENWFGES